MNQRDHDPRRGPQIWFPAVPQPQIPHYHAALLDYRLAWTPYLSSRLEEVLLDPAARPIAVLAFLVCDAGGTVRAEPDLCGPVLGRHGHEGDVDDECEWDGWVVEVGIGVCWL